LREQSQSLHAEQRFGGLINTNGGVAVLHHKAVASLISYLPKQETHTVLSVFFQCHLFSWPEKTESSFWDRQEPLEDTLCGQV